MIVVAGVTLDALGSGVPARDMPIDVQHEDRVVDDTAHQLAELQLRAAQLAGALRDTLLELFVELLQLLLSALALAEQAGVVHRDRRLRRDAADHQLVLMREHAGRGVAEEQAAVHLALARHDGTAR